MAENDIEIHEFRFLGIMWRMFVSRNKKNWEKDRTYLHRAFNTLKKVFRLIIFDRPSVPIRFASDLFVEIVTGMMESITEPILIRSNDLLKEIYLWMKHSAK